MYLEAIVDESLLAWAIGIRHVIRGFLFVSSTRDPRAVSAAADFG
jgi:hypothetical protein